MNSAGWTQAQFWLGAAGFIGLVATVIYAIRAFGQTAIQAKAALRANAKATIANVIARDVGNKQVAQTQRIGEAQVRAYVWTTGPRFDFKTVGGKHSCTVTVDLRNRGGSPAMVVKTACSVSTIENDFVAEIPHIGLLKSLSEVHVSGRFIPPDGETFTNATNSLDHDQIAKWARGDCAVVVIGEVIFDDVFDKRFCVEFCMRCKYQPDGKIDVRMYPRHNRPQYLI